jgi:hypothetical protein
VVTNHEIIKSVQQLAHTHGCRLIGRKVLRLNPAARTGRYETSREENDPKPVTT